MQQFVFMNNVLAMDFFLCLYFALTCQQDRILNIVTREVNVEEACLTTICLDYFTNGIAVQKFGGFNKSTNHVLENGYGMT